VKHEIPLERRTLHGHFSRDLQPILTLDSGDTVAFSCLDAGWNIEPGRKFEPRSGELDDGHALIGPIEIRGAKAGQTLEVRIEDVRVGTWGSTFAGGWQTPFNDELGVSDGDGVALQWNLDADAAVGRDENGREVDLRPFPGVLGMPPPEPGVHSTGPPRPFGGNVDCKELVAGTKLLLPIPVNGALFSAGDGHARQGDGEVSQTAIECPLDRLELTLTLEDEPRLERSRASSSTSESRRWSTACEAFTRSWRTTRSECADDAVRVQAPRPRRRPDGRRDLTMARVRGPGRRRR
jgi:acetamidase/formamidase